MRRVLVTGMSGTGKSTALQELRKRGFQVVDTDEPGWTVWDEQDDGYVWREDRIVEILSIDEGPTLYVSGTASNQGRFYPRFDAVVLLSAPAEILLSRIEARTTNQYGKTAAERELVLRHLEEVEPLLRATCTHEIDATRPIGEVVARLAEIGASVRSPPGMASVDTQQSTPRLLSIDELRAQFPGLSPDVAALDGAAGTQVPRAVLDAVAAALATAMANAGGAFGASRVSTQVVAEARSAIADLVGGVPEGVVLGPNMTTLTFHFADALAATWTPGDEIVVTALDHDANIRPWQLAAERVGATVRMAEFDAATGELPVAAIEQVLSERTRLVAVTAASNAIGTRPDVTAISQAAHAAGAVTYIDGVHATPHVPIDVSALGADFYACSSYKFCGPHAGVVVADPAVLERLRPAKLLPAPDHGPARFERGTPPFELLAGVRAAVDWLAGLTDASGDRRARLLASFTAVEMRLQTLLERLVDGLSGIDGVRLLGDPARRTSTVSFVVDGHTPSAIAARLAEQGIAVWDGDNYAHELMRRFGLAETGGAVRASIVLYNTADEIDRLVQAVGDLATRG